MPQTDGVETRTGATKRVEIEVESIEAQKAAQAKRARDEQERVALEKRKFGDAERYLRDEQERLVQERQRLAESEKSLTQVIESLRLGINQIAADNRQIKVDMAKLMSRDTSAPSSSGFSEISTPRKNLHRNTVSYADRRTIETRQIPAEEQHDDTVVYRERSVSRSQQAPGDEQASFAEPSPRTVPEISLSQAVSVVPPFNGDNIGVMQYVRAVKRACEMVPSYAEEDLVRLIIGRLEGRAYRLMEDAQCTSAHRLCETLRKRFDSGRALLQYKCDLSTIHRNRGEHMIDYTCRVKDLRCAIMEATRKENGQIEPSELVAIDTLTRQSYIRGLPPTMRDKLSRRPDLSLAELFEAGYDAFEEYARDCRLHGTPDDADRNAASHKQRPRDDKPRQPTAASCNGCGRAGHTIDRCWANKRVIPPDQRPLNNRAAPETCAYCKNIGHNINECRKKQRNDAFRQQGNFQSPPIATDANRQGAQAKSRPLHTIRQSDGSEILH